MYKKLNQYLFDFSVGISLISVIFIKNIYLYLIFSILFLYFSINRKTFKLSLITFFVAVFNSFCGKLLFFSKILLFFDIFLWITRDLSKKNKICLCGNIFNCVKFRKFIIFAFYVKYLYSISYKKGYDIDTIFSILKYNINSLYFEFERRLFFNFHKSGYKYLSNNDLINICVIICVFALSIML